MRCHFDVFEISRVLPDDIDLVWSHLPEHTLQLMNLIYNKTNNRPGVLGYCHWFELDAVTNTPRNVFDLSILGILQMNRCYVNTQHQKSMVLTQAANTYSSDVISRLDKIIEVFYLGVHGSDIRATDMYAKNTIVFNHRPEKYKHFDGFVDICDDLYKQRQDFHVWVPLLDNPIRPYMSCKKPASKQDYYNTLRTCLVGFAPKQAYGGWSIAALDGMMNGVPYIMYDDTYYHELWPDADFFTTKKDAVVLLNKYLDSRSYRDNKSIQATSYIKAHLLYKNSIQKLSTQINAIVDTLDNDLSATSTMPANMLQMIQTFGPVSKVDLCKLLKWGEAIPYTAVKRRLIKENKILDLHEQNPTYIVATEADTYKKLF
jgi:hypothetical protein